MHPASVSASVKLRRDRALRRGKIICHQTARRDKSAVSASCRKANRRKSVKPTVCYWVKPGVFSTAFLRVISATNNVHPPLVVFLNIIKVPVFPAPVFGFAFSNSRGHLFHINDAIRSLQSSTLMDDNVEICVINILNGLVGCGWKVLIKILIVGSIGCGATSG